MRVLYTPPGIVGGSIEFCDCLKLSSCGLPELNDCSLYWLTLLLLKVGLLFTNSFPNLVKPSGCH